ncbi:MAG: pyridoxal phosphate-dependent aminotransferase family protein [Sphingobacteriaceae bacterium]|nr:pyridoxal phosphate-dependent aminotransferase family protein [Sphingobacteriaceae bacterium]
MRKDLPFHLMSMLSEREHKGLLRELKTDFPPIDFCSNDYLGFSVTGKLKNALVQYPDQDIKSGSTGSRLISGNSLFAEKLEAKIAAYHQSEAALIFNSGYDANLALFSSVPQKNDVVLYDELIHASIHDGIRLSYANRYKFKHNDVQEVKELILRNKDTAYNIFIAVESVYSMDGDLAPIKELIELSNLFKNVYLIVDEAHAIGVFGEQGRGLCAEPVIANQCFARLYTYGKAMGCHGAAIVCNQDLKKYLINFARSFIYTTALPAHSLRTIDVAYNLISSNKDQVKLQENINYFNSISADLFVIKNQSAIRCLITGSNKKAEQLETKLATEGIYTKAIKSPTVKEGTERLRICIHSFNTKEEMDKLVSVLKKNRVE